MEPIREYIDKQGRHIDIIIDDDNRCCRAIHNRNEVGLFEYDFIEEDFGPIQRDYILICHMNVISDYRYCGIGKEIIKSLLNYYEYRIEFPIDKVIAGNSPYYLTGDGPYFKRSCIKANLIVE